MQFTVQQIINRAAAQADMDGNFVSPSTWIDWFNVEQRNLVLLTARQGWVFDGPRIVTASPTSDTFSINEDFFAIITIVEVDPVSGKVRHIPITNYMDFLRQNTGGSITGPAQFATVAADYTSTVDSTQIYLYPRPTSGTYQVHYIPVPTASASLTDSYNYPMGIEEWVVLKLAKRALTKEESDTSAVRELLKEQEGFVEEYSASKLWANAPAVRNSDDVNRGWDHRLVYPPPNTWFWV